MSEMMLLGKSVAHSLSPVMYEAAFAKMGLDWTYEVADLACEDEARELIEHGEWMAMNITTPYKRLAFELAGAAEDTAHAAGGANLLVRTTDGIKAFNTDGTGCTAFLARNGAAPQGRNVAVCGTGPTARAIVYAASCAGVKRVAMFSRDKERCIEAAQHTCGGVFAQTYEDGAEFLRAADVIIDATTLGMTPGDPAPFDTALLSAGQTVLDVVYGHGETALIAAAKAAGCTTYDGRGMLIMQACVSLQKMLALLPELPRISFLDAANVMTAATEA